MIRTHTVRLYPNQIQEASLIIWFECCRRLYNAFLEQRIKAYSRRKQTIGFFTQSARIKVWRANDKRMACVPFAALRQSAKRVDRAFQAFFRRVKAGKKPGYPRFKGQDRLRSIELSQPYKYVQHGKIHIPNMGKVKCRNLRIPDGTWCQQLLILCRAGKWHVQIMIDDGKPAPPKKPIESAVGIDVGIKCLLATSTGELIENPRHLKKAEERLKRLDRKLSRKKLGSKNRQKLRDKRCKAYEKVANCRKHFIHTISKGIVSKFDLIATESLNVSEMVRSRFSKLIFDASWSFLRHCLKYKAESAGVHYVEVDARGTSQECSQCGRIVLKNLSVRTHKCTCGLIIDRDVNAARNILKRVPPLGRDLMPVEDLALASPMKQEVL